MSNDGATGGDGSRVPKATKDSVHIRLTGPQAAALDAAVRDASVPTNRTALATMLLEQAIERTYGVAGDYPIKEGE